MNDCQYLYEVLRLEVEKNGDDVLTDSNLLSRILVNYPQLNLPQDSIAALSVAISKDLASILHYHYAWDTITINSINEFAEKHNIEENVLQYIAEAYAYALEIIEKVEAKKPPKKPRNRKLTLEEINAMLDVEECFCRTLKITSIPACYDSSYNIKFTAFISGKFGPDIVGDPFDAGMFSIRLYDKDKNIIQNWHRTSIYTVPLYKKDKSVKGFIEITLDPIYTKDKVHSIVLSFTSTKYFSDSIDKYNIDTSWFEYE